MIKSWVTDNLSNNNFSSRDIFFLLMSHFCSFPILFDSPPAYPLYNFAFLLSFLLNSIFHLVNQLRCYFLFFSSLKSKGSGRLSVRSHYDYSVRDQPGYYQLVDNFGRRIADSKECHLELNRNVGKIRIEVCWMIDKDPHYFELLFDHCFYWGNLKYAS